MRVRPDVDALPGDKLCRPHLIEENEWPDHLPLRRGKRAADFEAAEVTRSWHDDLLHDITGLGVAGYGVVIR
jgi:hypothetical protein